MEVSVSLDGKDGLSGQCILSPTFVGFFVFVCQMDLMVIVFCMLAGILIAFDMNESSLSDYLM